VADIEGLGSDGAGGSDAGWGVQTNTIKGGAVGSLALQGRVGEGGNGSVDCRCLPSKLVERHLNTWRKGGRAAGEQGMLGGLTNERSPGQGRGV
jgi:hypothetical protein